MTAVVVTAVGPLALVQDLGRPGHAALGVTGSGAADRTALRLANRVLGNDEGAACIEVLLGGLALRAEGRVTVCVSGAPVLLSLNGSSADQYVPLDLRDGDVLAIGGPVRGLRSYVALRGGITVPLALGSASSDVTSGLGPPPLAPGSRLEIGAAGGSVVASDLASSRASFDAVMVRVVLGPRDDWFSVDAIRLLGSMAWTVSPDSDRVASRLSGPELTRRCAGELPSEGVVRGSIQVPASGQPLVFLADHPTTGGYPVIAVVLDADTDLLGQARPGDRVRFSPRRRSW